MKPILFIALTFYLACAACAQNKQLTFTSEDTIKLLCNKWMLVTMSIQGKSANVPASKALYVTYKPGGNYTDSSARFGVIDGSWNYDSTTQILSTTEKGGTSKAKIVKLDTNELIMKIEKPTVAMSVTYRRVDQ